MDESVSKAATGIEGLDDILSGGLPQGRPTLVCGNAGCGKTLLAMEAQEILHAIHIGQIDALVVSTDSGEKVFTLQGADHPFRVLIENMSEGALTITAGGLILFSNQRFAEMLDMPLENVIGSSLMDWVTPADQGILRQLLNQEKRRSGVFDLVGRNGGLTPTQLSLIGLQAEDMEGIICIVATDLTEPMQAEQALKESEMRYRLLVEEANEAIVVIQDGIIKFANRNAEKLFGPITDVNPVLFKEFVHPDDRDLILGRPRKRQKDYKLDNPFNYRLIAHEGSIKYIEENSVKIMWEGQSGILALLTDVTEVKKMEEEILRADKLESIGLLAGGIAHDLNNYLAILLGNVNLARLHMDNGQKILDRMQRIENAILSARELANQLFTFSTGGDPVKERFDIRSTIFDDIKFALSGSNIIPKMEIAEDLYLLEADKGQLRQVLNNMVINGVQAMPEGGILKIQAANVAIGLTDLDPTQKTLTGGPYVKITIKDEGTGIPEKHLSKIFDPFFTTKEKGRGLGLATSYSIIKKHGGFLNVESQVDVGTSFSIYLPAILHTEMKPNTNHHVFEGKGKILVMDDEEDLLTVTGEALKTLGYDVSLVRDGGEAIEQYMHHLNQGHPFDLIIMDLTIPGGLGGKRVISELLKKDPHVKAVVASGYSNGPIMANYHDYGFKGMMRKPFTIQELSALVRQIIG